LVVEIAHPTATAAPTLRATLETAMTLFALSAVVFVAIGVAYSRQLHDVLLLGAVLTLGLTFLCAYSLPLAAHTGFARWMPGTVILGGLCAAGLFTAASRTPTYKTYGQLRRPVAAIAAASVTAIAVAMLGAFLLRGPLADHAPDAVADTATILRHHGVLVVLLIIVGAALFLYAARSTARASTSAERDRVALMPSALVLLAAAQTSYLALPSVALDDVAPSLALRFVAVALLFAAAVRHAMLAHVSADERASIAERRRIASDLHDGLTQDLALIAAYGDHIAGELGCDHPVVIAARRALTVSRGTIAALSDPPGACVETALRAVAAELRDRYAIDVSVDVQLDREPPPQVREHVSRITREAITNATRHGRAHSVLVTLTRAGGATVLRVCDDGCGISSSVRPGPGAGFGLRSMRERAAAIGGSLSVQPRDSHGTVVEVVFP
jgi:signal transduction histidine kinase